MISRKIYIRTQKEGIHRYPAAATDPNLSDVSFLANPHRHIFHFHVAISVVHNDRDLEFILVKRNIEDWLSTVYDIDYKSCEMMAEDLLEYLRTYYGSNRQYIIDVSEDNENGAIIQWN
jgi:hypothetical protein